MNLKIFAAALVSAAMLLPATSDAQSRRDRDRDRDRGRYDRPWRGQNNPGNWNRTRYDRIQQWDRYNSGWPYGYPRDYRWPYGRSYNLGTGQLWTPRGADVYYINGVRVYLPR